MSLRFPSSPGAEAVRALVLVLVLGLGGCVTGEALWAEAAAIRGQLDLARSRGAYRCAPIELAEAEAHLEFLLAELDQGDAVRAAEHRDRADEAARIALDRSQACMVRDRDEDGVADEVDRCPSVAGLPALEGCPDGDGDGVADDRDRCPSAAGLVTLEGCADGDGDGVADDLDRCPGQPEDRDGVEDDDGCPELEDSDGDGLVGEDDACPDQAGPADNRGCPWGDRDGDGLLDPDDACPDQPETPNGFEDEDGCPDVELTLVEVRRDEGKIAIKQKVNFPTGRATIQSVSYEVLNQVAEALKISPTMTVIVEGHTDSTGSDSGNLRLSQARADAVLAYLVAQGIDEARLTAIGFGEDKPIDTNATRIGRERNRRVEFTITGE